MRISDWSSDVCSSDLDRRIDHRARQPKLEFAGIAAPGMRVDVIQIDAPGGAHTGEFARPATAVRVQGRDLGGKTGIAGLRAKPVGEGRREPARELARANRRRVEFGKLDEPPGEADRKSTRLNSSHYCAPSMPYSA